MRYNLQCHHCRTAVRLQCDSMASERLHNEYGTNSVWLQCDDGTTAVRVQHDYIARLYHDYGTTPARVYGTIVTRLRYDCSTTVYDCITSMTQIWYDYNATMTPLRTSATRLYSSTMTRLRYDCSKTSVRLRAIMTWLRIRLKYDYSTIVERLHHNYNTRAVGLKCNKWHDCGSTGIRQQYDYTTTSFTTTDWLPYDW